MRYLTFFLFCSCTSASIYNLKIVTDANPDYSDLPSLVHSATANFNPLGNASLLNQTSSPTLSALDATTMPTIAAVLQSFDIIVLDDFTTSRRWGIGEIT